MEQEITREIGIDAGHRVTYHHSKCRNLHGHRYVVQATVRGELVTETRDSQNGMVLDFGFLKDLMMSAIDQPCDHGLILWDLDPIVRELLKLDIDSVGIVRFGAQSIQHDVVGKVYIVPFVPTVENLAAHWFSRLSERVADIN